MAAVTFFTNSVDPNEHFLALGGEPPSPNSGSHGPHTSHPTANVRIFLTRTYILKPTQVQSGKFALCAIKHVTR